MAIKLMYLPFSLHLSVQKKSEKWTFIFHLFTVFLCSFVAALNTYTIHFMTLMQMDHESQLAHYNSKLKMTLFRHLSLWSQACRLFTYYIKDRQQIDFTTILEQSPSLLTRVVNSGPPQGTGKFGSVYKVSLLTDDNEWNLKAGDYAFKVSKTSKCISHLKNEQLNLPTLQYVNVIKFVGVGSGQLSDMSVEFLVTNWVSGGDLESRMKDLTWDQVKLILRGLAYAIYTVHRTGDTCLCDLKPANILLDEYHNPILCDLGGAATSKSVVPVDSSLYTCADDDRGVSYALDVFTFGIILFQLLTDIVEPDFGEKVAKRIASYIDQVENLYALVKPQLKENGCQEEIAGELLKLGAKCICHKDIRASDLEILEELHEMFDYEMVNCLLF